MKNNFKPGECALCTTQDEYEALKAVMLADGWPISILHGGWGGPYYDYGLCPEGGFMLVCARESNVLALKEALFRGAPEWATLLVKNSSRDFVWLEHADISQKTKIKFVNEPDYQDELTAPSDHEWHKAEVIARREPQKTPVQQLAEILSEWPDCHGKAGLLAKSHPEFAIVTAWRGNGWRTESINGVTKSEWLAGRYHFEQKDMIKLAGRDNEKMLSKDIDEWFHHNKAIVKPLTEFLAGKGWTKK